MKIKTFFLRCFTWWNGQTFGTQVWTSLYGERVGEDEFGNIYYRTKGGKIDPSLGFENPAKPGERIRAGFAQHLSLVLNQPLETLCDELLARLLPGEADDDVALVAVRTHPENRPRPEGIAPANVPDLVRADLGTSPAAEHFLEHLKMEQASILKHGGTGNRPVFHWPALTRDTGMAKNRARWRMEAAEADRSSRFLG